MNYLDTLPVEVRNVDIQTNWMQWQRPYPQGNFPRASYGGAGNPPGAGMRGLLGLGAAMALGQNGEAAETVADMANGEAMRDPEYSRAVAEEAARKLVKISPFVGIAGAALSGYHGFERNRGNLGWGFAWGVLGYLFPVVTVPIAFAQGYGKRKRRR